MTTPTKPADDKQLDAVIAEFQTFVEEDIDPHVLATLKAELKAWADNRTYTEQQSEGVDETKPTIDPSALEFYFEAVLPEVSVDTRAHMARAIRIGATAWSNRRTAAVLSRLLSEVPGDNYAPSGSQVSVEATNEERRRRREQLQRALAALTPPKEVK